jgi:hypothetical protein
MVFTKTTTGKPCIVIDHMAYYREEMKPKESVNYYRYRCPLP